MKPGSFCLCLFLLASLSSLTNCTSSRSKTTTASTSADKPAPVKPGDGTDAVDDLDDYGDAVVVSDPLEGLNRATFKLNDGLYNVVLRPVSKGYVAVTPQPVRRGLDNFFDNLKFPVRFVNSGLQGKFGRAGKEAQKFGVNTVAGFGGFIRQSDKIPSLASVPSEDTGQTLAKWGIGHGPYLVLPVVGPSSLRDSVGYAGDYVLNPVHWGIFAKGDTPTWTWIPGAVNTVRSLPDQLALYDESRLNAVDPYISIRSIYIQNRDAAAAD